MEVIDLSGLSIVYRGLDGLKPYPRNAREHSKHQIRQIAESIKVFGFTNPVLIDKSDTIIAGHGRVAAAKLLGLKQVPTIRLEHLTEEQIRVYILADNKLAENAGWDKAILAIEFQYLLTIQDDIDITVTGFEVPEIDLVIESELSKPTPEEIVPIVEGPAVSRLGDLWLLGEHRLLCGNATEEAHYTALMGGKAADIIWSDPPYNVPVNGNVAGHGATHYREFPVASGEMDQAEFTVFLKTCLGLLARHSADGSIHFVCMDWRHLEELLAAGKQSYSELLNICIWVKDNGGLGSFYRSQHEMILVYRRGRARHQNNIMLGAHGRNRTNIWKYPGAVTQSRSKEEGNLLELHPTIKPVALVADALLDCSRRGDVVLDAFLGSGTTLMAAERMGRICYGLELDPLYVDTAVRRWQRYTGGHAAHAATGESFDDLAKAIKEGRNA